MTCTFPFSHLVRALESVVGPKLSWHMADQPDMLAIRGTSLHFAPMQAKPMGHQQ